MHVLQNIQHVETLLHTLQSLSTLPEKIACLNQQVEVQNYLAANSEIRNFLKNASLEDEWVLKSVMAIGQGPIVLDADSLGCYSSRKMEELLVSLQEVEKFYQPIGGIIGYHLVTWQRICAETEKIPPQSPSTQHYYKPAGFDITHATPQTLHAALYGIAHLPHMAELYVVGGAGDRLDLHEEFTGEALPAVCLRFCGRTLLEGLIRDLQGREYLYYKLHGKQSLTPIALMTSQEKGNHAHVLQLCENTQWFGRPRQTFHLMIQPMVPMLTEQGNWVMLAPLQPLLKPGGHGLVWKLAQDRGILDRFKADGRTALLIRQINNPAAGIDYGLSAFVGIGNQHGKGFGFASCERIVNTAQGMDVLIETETPPGPSGSSGPQGVSYCITNIEYTEFKQKGIQDTPLTSGSSYSQFPANTNILFARLNTIQKAIEKNPFPGLITNMKSRVHVGHEKVSAGRLESTMQNIADALVEHFPEKLHTLTPTSLQTYVTYNERRKTISVVKRAYTPGGSLLETPEGCFYDLLRNHRELLEGCSFTLPPMRTEQEYLEKGPEFLFEFHPALGPFYHIIHQKLRKGSLAPGAELQLEIAEADISNLYLEGSLHITARNILGGSSPEAPYGNGGGKCTLHNVRILNQGIDYSANNRFWKHEISRRASMQIILHGNGEFFAENVTFHGNQYLEVPDQHRLTVKMEGDQLDYHLEPLTTPWHWRYTIDAAGQVMLS